MGLLSAALKAELQTPGWTGAWLLEIDFPGGTKRYGSVGYASAASGFYEPRVVTWGSIIRSAADPRGHMAPVTASVTLADTDQTLGALFAGALAGSVRGSAARIYLAAADLAKASWFTAFTGRVVGWHMVEPYRWELQLKTRDDQLSAYIINTQLGLDWPSIKVDYASTLSPLAFGALDSGGDRGSIPCPYVHTGKFQYVVCLGTPYAINRVFSAGVLKATPADYSVVVQTTPTGRTYTIVDFVNDQGSNAITADVEGYGLGPQTYSSWVPIYTAMPSEILRALLEIHYNGAWLGAGGSLSGVGGLPTGYAPLDGTSWDAIRTFQLSRIPTSAWSSIGGRYLGGQTQVRAVDEIDAFCAQNEMRVYWTGAGTLGIGALIPEQTDNYISAPWIRWDSGHFLDMPVPEYDGSGLFDSRLVQGGWNESLGQYQETALVKDSSVGLGAQDSLQQKWNCQRGALYGRATCRDVGSRFLRAHKRQVGTLRARVAWEFLDVELLARIAVSLPWWPAADGLGAGVLDYQRREMLVEEIAIDPNPGGSLTLLLRDLRHYRTLQWDTLQVPAGWKMDQDGVARIETGQRRAWGPGPAYILNASDLQTVVKADPNATPTGIFANDQFLAQAIEKGGLLIEGERVNRWIRSSFISGSTGWTLAGVPNNATPNIILFDPAITPNALKWVAGTANVNDGTATSQASTSIPANTIETVTIDHYDDPAVTLAASKTPDQVTGLVEWLKADVLALNDGDPVGTWTASAGSDATGAGAQRPTYRKNDGTVVTSDGLLNAKPYVHFDGVANYLATGNVDFTTNNEVTAFAVVRALGGGNARWLTSATDFTHSGTGQWAYRNVVATPATEWDVDTTGVNVIHSLAAAAGWWLLCATFKKSGNQLTYTSGTQRTTATATAFNLQNTPIFLGGWNAGYSSLDCAEVICYNVQLSTANRQAIESYLDAKYNLGLSASDMYASLQRSVDSKYWNGVGAAWQTAIYYNKLSSATVLANSRSKIFSATVGAGGATTFTTKLLQPAGGRDGRINEAFHVQCEDGAYESSRMLNDASVLTRSRSALVIGNGNHAAVTGEGYRCVYSDRQTTVLQVTTEWGDTDLAAGDHRTVWHAYYDASNEERLWWDATNKKWTYTVVAAGASTTTTSAATTVTKGTTYTLAVRRCSASGEAGLAARTISVFVNGTKGTDAVAGVPTQSNHGRVILGCRWDATKLPSDIASLKGWWKADAGIVRSADGSAVTEWDDQSGNGRNAVQATASKQPLFTEDTYAGLFLPSVNPRGSSNQFLDVTVGNLTNLITDKDNWTVICCATWVFDQAQVNIYDDPSAWCGSGAYIGLVGRTGGIITAYTRDNGAVYRTVNAGSTLVTLQPYVVAVKMVSGTLKCGVNTGTTAEMSSLAITTAVVPTETFRLGGRGSVASDSENEKLYEVALFNTALSESDTQAIVAYMILKWVGKSGSTLNPLHANALGQSGCGYSVKATQHLDGWIKQLDQTQLVLTDAEIAARP